MNTLKFQGDTEGNVKSIVLETREEIPASMVIIGEGNVINNQLARDAGL